MEHNRQIHIIGNMYAFTQGDKANVVIRPTDLQACLEVLEENKCDVLTGQNL